MASTPHPAPKPEPPPPRPRTRHADDEDDDKVVSPAVPAKTEQKAEPEKIVTVQEEQLARSAEIEAMGVDKWKEAHSAKPPVVEEPAPKAKS